MSDVKAGDRPKFDFVGSLDLAAQMYALADELESANEKRNKAWGAALDAWKGAVGDRFRNFVDNDSAEMEETAKILREEAQMWASLWAETVNQTNAVLQSEAWERLKQRLDAADEGFKSKVVNILGLGEKDKAGFDSVPKTPDIGVPTEPSFDPPRSPFALYVMVGDSVHISGYSYQLPAYSGACYA